MALKNYRWRGYTWQFDESEAPADAVPVDAGEEKAAPKPSDKAARRPSDKAAARPAAKRG